VIRAILETNLLISYLLTHRPPIAMLLGDLLAKDGFAMVTAPELLAELDRVLKYPKLQRHYTGEERTRFVAMVLSLSEAAELPETIPRICRDPEDDWLIACAVVGEADMVVSGDADLLALKRVGGIPIVMAAQFVEMLEGEDSE
jgi:putative PIN family toxin of toxin-antitoxin system